MLVAHRGSGAGLALLGDDMLSGVLRRSMPVKEHCRFRLVCPPIEISASTLIRGGISGLVRGLGAQALLSESVRIGPTPSLSSLAGDMPRIRLERSRSADPRKSCI
jgi:hypothetical protein